MVEGGGSMGGGGILSPDDMHATARSRVDDSHNWVSGSGFRVQDSGFRIRTTGR